MKKALMSIFLLSLPYIAFSEEIFTGYYITGSGDTISAKIVIADLYQLHREVVIIDSTGKRQSLKPFDIKGFSFTIKGMLNFNRPVEDIDHSDDQLILNTGYLYKHKVFSLDAEIHGNPIFPDSVLYYESCKIARDVNLFLLVMDGQDGDLKSGKYFSRLESETSYFSTVWFLVKNNCAVPHNDAKLEDWLMKCIDDYPMLTSLVKEKKIAAFPFDFHIAIDDYNLRAKSDVFERPDTSMTIKGILDADKHYKTAKHFAIPCVTGTAFFLPGLASAVIISHVPKENKIKIPQKLHGRDNPDYAKAFRHSAYDRKYRAAGRGAVTGGILSIGLIILIASLH